MTIRRRKFIVSLLLHVPFLLILYVLQATVFTSLPLFGVKPLILPVAVVGVALFEGSTKGGVFGLFAGQSADGAVYADADDTGYSCRPCMRYGAGTGVPVVSGDYGCFPDCLVVFADVWPAVFPRSRTFAASGYGHPSDSVFPVFHDSNLLLRACD